MVVFLASGRANWVSGACITVDGCQSRSFDLSRPDLATAQKVSQRTAGQLDYCSIFNYFFNYKIYKDRSNGSHSRIERDGTAD